MIYYLFTSQQQIPILHKKMPSLLQKLKPILQKDDTVQGYQKFQQILLQQSSPNSNDINVLLRWSINYQKKQFANYYQLLTKLGANVNFVDTKDKRSNLMIACDGKKEDIVEILVKDKNIDILIQDNRNKNALYYAIYNKNKVMGEKYVRILLQKCPQLLTKVSKMSNPLAQAISQNRSQIVKILLQYKIAVNNPIQQNGNTALHQCVKLIKTNIKHKLIVNTLKNIIQNLLEKGADPYIKNQQGKNVFQFADKFAEEFQRIYQNYKSNSSGSNNNNNQVNYRPKDNNNSNKEDKQNRVQPVLKINDPNQRQAIFTDAEQIFNKYKHLLAQSQPTPKTPTIPNTNPTLTKKSALPPYSPLSSTQPCDPFQPSLQFLPQLTTQIQLFTNQCILDHQAARKDLDQFIKYLAPIVNGLGFVIQVYGSYATGLWINQCDIDILLVPRDMLMINQVYQYLDKIAQRLKGTLYDKCSILKNIKIPLMRIQIPQQSTNSLVGRRSSYPRKLDLSILSPNNNGLQHRDYILQLTLHYPNIKPLFLIIKKLTHCYKLYDPIRAGVRSFAIFLMLVIFIQQQTGAQSLGQLLLRFLYKYGYQYLYQYQDPINYSGNLLLNLPDPVNAKNNIGKNTDAFQLQRMFKTAYMVLHTRAVQDDDRGQGIGSRLQLMFQSKDMFVGQQIGQQVYGYGVNG